MRHYLGLARWLRRFGGIPLLLPLAAWAANPVPPAFFSQPVLIFSQSPGIFHNFSYDHSSRQLRSEFASSSVAVGKIVAIQAMPQEFQSQTRYFALDHKQSLWEMTNVATKVPTMVGRITAITLEDPDNLLLADASGDIYRMDARLGHSRTQGLLVPALSGGQLLVAQGNTSAIIAMEKISPDHLVLMRQDGNLQIVSVAQKTLLGEFRFKVAFYTADKMIACDSGAWIMLSDHSTGLLYWFEFSWSPASRKYTITQSCGSGLDRNSSLLDIDPISRNLYALSHFGYLYAYELLPSPKGLMVNPAGTDTQTFDPKALISLNPASAAVNSRERFVSTARTGFVWRGANRFTPISGVAATTSSAPDPPAIWGEEENVSNPVTAEDFAKLLAYEWRHLLRRPAPADGEVNAVDLFNFLKDDRNDWWGKARVLPGIENAIAPAMVIEGRNLRLVAGYEGKRISLPKLARDVAAGCVGLIAPP